jgi:hypothetical protein
MLRLSEEILKMKRQQKPVFLLGQKETLLSMFKNV